MKYQLSTLALLLALLTKQAACTVSEGHIRLRGERVGVHEVSLQPEAPNPDHNPETPIDTGIPGTERMNMTVETLIAFVYIILIASVPLVLRHFDNSKDMSRVAMGQAVALFIWLTGGVYLFTNVLLFQSGHFDTVRSLTLVETIYLFSQIITTVGYGDITPALPRGQVFIGIFVLLSILLIADMVSSVAQIMLEEAEEAVSVIRRYSSHGALPEVETTPQPEEDASDGAAIPKGPLMVWITSFVTLVLAGVLFFHFYPGEEKTWLQAVYMSIITLSTVGFGALTATTEMGKAFSAFWMLFGVVALGGVVGSFTEVMRDKKEDERRTRKVEPETFKDMVTQLKVLKEGQTVEAAAADVGVTRVDKSQFLKFELLKTGKVPLELLNAIEQAFVSLEPGASGKVDFSLVEKVWTKSRVSAC